jgi:hypothetical protein
MIDYTALAYMLKVRGARTNGAARIITESARPRCSQTGVLLRRRRSPF